jgi:hypothetical protein
VRSFGLALVTIAFAAVVAACGSQPPPPAPPITVSQTLIQSTPPPVVSTPVPVVHARKVPGAGRPDPFVALYGPPGTSTTVKPSKSVSVSAFPKIPTLPGFTSGPGGETHSVWDGVALTGVVRDAGYTAIVAVNTQSYIVRQGDTVGGKFRVVAIGPDFVTLATTAAPVAERTFSLGG